MEIYTSYWANVRKFPPNLVGLNTTVWPPKWRPMGKDARGVICIDCPPLKPGIECEGLCRGICDPPHPKDCTFLQTYRKQLDIIDFRAFLFRLEEFRIDIGHDEHINPEDINFALLVFEAPAKLCSERWPLQDWLRANNFKGEEWKPNI